MMAFSLLYCASKGQNASGRKLGTSKKGLMCHATLDNQKLLEFKGNDPKTGKSERTWWLLPKLG
jgi:hypothetical protein